MAKSNEPLWWVPFMGGAMVAALLMPILVIITGLALPFGMVTDDQMWTVLQNPWARCILFIVISLSLFHGFHRLLYLLIDLGLKKARPALSVVCYGSAIVGTTLAALIALHVIS